MSARGGRAFTVGRARYDQGVLRRARQVWSEGRDPDPRFTFANERTFLAWIRTSLALVAGGIGIDTFLVDMAVIPRRLLASALLVLGAGLALDSYRRWVNAEWAMRTGSTLPRPGVAAVLAVGVGVVALVLLGVVLISGYAP
jgi:inner membrane protein YidH